MTKVLWHIHETRAKALMDLSNIAQDFKDKPGTKFKVVPRKGYSIEVTPPRKGSKPKTSNNQGKRRKKTSSQFSF
jgi:hypothetical protein